MDDNSLKIINPGDDIDTCYGLNKIELEPEHLLALIECKELYCTINVGEYAIIIKRKGGCTW